MASVYGISVKDRLNETSGLSILKKKGTVNAGAMGKQFLSFEKAFDAAKAAAQSAPLLGNTIMTLIDVVKKIGQFKGILPHATADLEADEKPSLKRSKSAFASVTKPRAQPPLPDMRRKARRAMGMDPLPK